MSAGAYVARLSAVTFGAYLAITGVLAMQGQFDGESNWWGIVGLGCLLFALGVVDGRGKDKP